MIQPKLHREEIQVYLQNFSLTKAGRNLVPWYELEGILFAVAVSPIMLPPSAWFDLIWRDGHGAGEYENMEHAEMFYQALMSLYNHINHLVNRGEAQKACTATLKEPALMNLEVDTPVQQWSSGFSRVSVEFAEEWDDYFDSGALKEKWVEEFLTRMTALSAFRSKKSFSETVEMLFEGPPREEESAKIFAENFHTSLQLLGMINLLIRGVEPSELS